MQEAEHLCVCVCIQSLLESLRSELSCVGVKVTFHFVRVGPAVSVLASTSDGGGLFVCFSGSGAGRRLTWLRTSRTHTHQAEQVCEDVGDHLNTIWRKT